MKSLLTKMSLSAAVLLGVQVTHGALLTSFESPTFTPGALNGQGNWVTSGSGTTASTIASGGLSYSSGTVAHAGGGQHARTTRGASGDHFSRTALPTSVAVGDTVYFSFLYKASATSFFRVGLTDTPTTLAQSLGVAYDAGFKARIEHAGSAERSSSASAGTLTAGTTYLVVAKVEYLATTGNGLQDKVSIQVNPTTGAEPVSWDQSISRVRASGTPPTLTHFYFHNGSGTEGTTWDVDFIRFGSTYSSVVVPEPTCLALLSGGGLLMLRRRRA